MPKLLRTKSSIQAREEAFLEKNKKQKWKPWPADPSVQYAGSDSGIEIRVADGEGYHHSEWCRLLGGDLDATIRRLLREMQAKSNG